MSVKEFVAVLDATDQERILDPAVAAALGLGDTVPTRFIDLNPQRPLWEGRSAALAYDGISPADMGTPRSIVIIDKTKSGKDATINHFQFDLTGRLIGAYVMVGKLDDKGKPVAGSAREVKQDLEDGSVVDAAKSELGFWLSGKYKQYPETRPLAPAAPPRVKAVR